ncbi:MAG: POTRA domain-containing protein [Terriglobales bacterium]
MADEHDAEEGDLRLKGVAHAGWLILLSALILSAATSWAVPPPQSGKQAEQVPAEFGAIAPYLGLTIDAIEFPGVGPEEAAALAALTPLKIGDALTRDGLHDAMKALFASGRFSDIQAEADRAQTTGVRLRFLTAANFFVGIVMVEGVSTNPSQNQLASATRLQLGELYSQDKVDRALAGVKRVLEENGFHRAKVTISEERDEKEHQVNITFRVVPESRAVVGELIVTGDSSYSAGEIQEIGKLHSGDPVISSRVSRALQRIRSRYQKQDRLLAQVSLADRAYHPERNTVDYTIAIDRGPVVEVAAEGFKLSRGTLRRLVPIYEEGAVDDDLLNEGRRNIENHLETLGYFEAKATVARHSVQDGKTLEVVYAIDPGERRKLAAIRISGNQYFPEELIRRRIAEQTAGRILSHGRYSEVLLDEDVRNIQLMYRASGFRQAEVSGELVTKYHGDPSLLAIQIKIREGLQTRVASVQIEGSYTLPQEQLPEISTSEGQGFDESSLSDDRDAILGKYFDNGFPNAAVDVSYVAVPAGPDGLPRVGVTFTIHEGEQFFVNDVYLNGLHYTRAGVARRALRVHSGEPLSQRNMLESQRRLYDLGLFSEVDTAIQNPDGTESRKNVLITTREAKRYTFDYGGGIEFQTGQPAVGSNQPLGQTGVSPRVLLGVNRINFGGREQTLTIKGNYGRLQKRGLASFDVPKLLNFDNLHFTATVFYDNTIDVSTFTSQRLEGSLRNLIVLYRQGERDLTTFSYGFSYRRVKASNIEVSSNLIPLLSAPTRVGSPNFMYIRNRRDNDLETTRGSYTSVEGAVAASYFGSEASFSKTLVKNSTYYSFGRNVTTGRRFVFARSTTIGVENPFGSTVIIDPSRRFCQPFVIIPDCVPQNAVLIPLPERFFSGGGNSHRGFGLNQAGPRDPITGFPLGGSAVFLNNLELRFPNVTVPYLQDKIGFSVFHDVGNVFARPQEMLPSIGRWHQPDRQVCFQPPTFPPTPQAQPVSQCNYNYVSHAIGLGVRYQTPIGPLTFDFGYNVNPPVFPSYTNITINSVSGVETGQFGAQRAGHFNFSFNVGQSF